MANETLTSVFGDIADAIREKGVVGTMTPLEMPQKIESITGGGGDDFGIPIDTLLGDVDQNGVLQAPSYVGTFEFSSDKITSVPQYWLYAKFKANTNITKVELPNLSTVGTSAFNQAFQNCTALTSVDLSSITQLGASGLNGAFKGCTSLTSVDLSSVTQLGASGLREAFSGCTSLVNVDLSSLVDASANTCLYQAFRGCTSLKNVYMNKMSVGNSASWNATFQNCKTLTLVDFSESTAVPAINTNTFGSTNTTFKIVVPDALYETWIAATNWSTRSSQIIKVSEYQASLGQ